MKHINNKLILGIVIASSFLLGSIVTPVTALQTNMVEEHYNYAYGPGANNHTYIYSPADDPLFIPSVMYTHFNEDIDLTSYGYTNTGWSSFSYGYSEDSTQLWSWSSINTLSGGTFGNGVTLPYFYDFVGSDGSGAVVNTTIERRSFSLAFGQQTAIAVESDYRYYGTLAISGQEFVHLTIAGLQDGIGWTITVYDPEGRQMGSQSGSGGDIVVLPFRPSTAGTYIVMVESAAVNGERVLFEILPTAVSPRLIAPGEVITDNLPTGEIVILDETGSLTHDELVPTVKTYKVDPGDDVSTLTYSFNYPTPLWGWFQGSSIMLTNDAFNYGTNGGSRYRSTSSFPSIGDYHIHGGVHYITVMGGDNIDFTLYHEADVATELPTNQEFQMVNIFSHSDIRVFSLTLDENTVLKCNTTTGTNQITARAMYDDGHRYSQGIDDGVTLLSSQLYYLPAGEYIFEVEVGMTSSDWIEFSVAPLTTATTTGIVNLGGITVPTDPGHRYNLTITLDNNYNVSVPMIVQIYNQFYVSQGSFSPTLGTWSDGMSQIPHSTHESTIEVTGATRIQSEDYSIIVIQAFPYNNTVGVGDYFENFPVNITINWEDVTFDNHKEAASIDATTSSGSYNFTMDFPGDSVEAYSLRVNTTPGVWYNVSIGSNDMSSINAIISYAPFHQRTHYTNWGDLNDALQGSAPDWSIQFGAISDSIYLDFSIDRTLVEEGHLSIEITPMETHTLQHPEPLAPGGLDILGMLGAAAIPIGIGVVVIVVVVVVYVKKFKK